MTSFELEDRLSDLIAFQCVLVVLRGVGFEASEEMLWQAFLSALAEQYSFAWAWYGRTAEGVVKPSVLFPMGAEELENLPAEIDENSEVLRDASLTLPVSIEGQVEGFIVCGAENKVPRARAEQIAILVSEATAAVEVLRWRAANEKALRQAKLQAESASRAKSQLLANMSHEIRTPLTGVLGFTDLLAETPLTIEQHDYVDTIRSSAQTLLSLINDILDFSKIEAGKFGLELAPVDIKKLLEKAVSVLAVQAAEKGLRLYFSAEPSAPRSIVGDAMRLRQILVNLLGNAVKFTSQGEVTLTVTGFQTPEGADHVLFEVHDTGPGIPKEHQERIFDSFTQVDASISRKFGGTGLGLAISRSLAEQMGGTLTVVSEEGQGATFRFTMPAKIVTDPVEMTPRKAPAVAPAVANLRVIVADDNSINRQVALAFLDRLGYHADSVSNGEELLSRIRQTKYDVVLMDVQMPEMDGIEATRRLRDWPEERQPKVIAMTASALPEDRARCIDAGMDDYISKPIDLTELATVLRRVGLQATGQVTRFRDVG